MREIKYGVVTGILIIIVSSILALILIVNILKYSTNFFTFIIIGFLYIIEGSFLIIGSNRDNREINIIFLLVGLFTTILFTVTTISLHIWYFNETEKIKGFTDISMGWFWVSCFLFYQNIFYSFLSIFLILLYSVNGYSLLVFFYYFLLFYYVINLIGIHNYLGSVKEGDFLDKYKNNRDFSRKYIQIKEKNKNFINLDIPKNGFQIRSNLNSNSRPQPQLTNLSTKEINQNNEDIISPNSSNIIEDKYYRKVHLEENFTIAKHLICPTCGTENSKYSRICKSCSSQFPICLVCKKAISKEDLVFCPFCNLPGHKLHLLEWLKINASCPGCKKELDMWEFQKYLEEYSQINDDNSKMCQKCKKFIPNNSNFCIFCGVKIKN